METAEEIAAALRAWTVEHSGHQARRDYIGLSHASSSVDEMVRFYFEGFPATEKDHLRFYKGFQMERDLLNRLRSVFGLRVSDAASPGVTEISAFRGRVKGHPDFWLDKLPGDIKCVPLDEHLPEPGRLPRRVYYQMQGYMAYSGKDRSLVIYESRETGTLRAFWIDPNLRVQREIDEKLRCAIGKLFPDA